MLRPLVGLGVAALALTGLVGCSSSGSASGGAPFKVSGAPVRTDKVEMVKTYKFAPAVIEVKAGTTVTWTNKEGTHTVTADDGSWESPTLNRGQSFSRKFGKPGTYRYYCSFHGSKGGHDMAGVVRVVR
jgi:plastocyanin